MAISFNSLVESMGTVDSPNVNVCTGMWKWISLKAIEVTYSPCWWDILMVSSSSILNFYALMNTFSLLRSSMGFHRLFGFGTKKSRLKTPRDL